MGLAIESDDGHIEIDCLNEADIESGDAREDVIVVIGGALQTTAGTPPVTLQITLVIMLAVCLIF